MSVVYRLVVAGVVVVVLGSAVARAQVVWPENVLAKAAEAALSRISDRGGHETEVKAGSVPDPVRNPLGTDRLQQSAG